MPAEAHRHLACFINLTGVLESVREAVAGGAPMSPAVARRVIALLREIRPPERANYDLTPLETRLLKLFVKGHNYKTAAAEFVRIGAELSDMELRRTK